MASNPKTHRRRRAALTAAVTVVAALTVAACGSSSSGSGKSGSAKGDTIALVPGLTTDPFYITMHSGAAAEAKRLGVTLIWQGGTMFSPTSQLPVVNSLLAKSPKALMIAPTDVKALKAPIQKFTNASIPVIAVDTTIDDTSLLTSQITSNNLQGGAAAADTIAKLAHDRGEVAVDNVNPGISTTDLRQQGFLTEIKKYPNMKVVATEYNNDSATLAESQVRNLILAHPGLVGVFGTNLYGAQGAGAAVNATNKKGKVYVVGYDAEPAETNLLKKGVINALVIQQPAVEGKLAVDYAVDKLEGKTSMIPKKTLVKNVVATTQNASSPTVKKYFYLSSFSG